LGCATRGITLDDDIDSLDQDFPQLSTFKLRRYMLDNKGFNLFPERACLKQLFQVLCGS
jgi:hypothetical protein